MKKIIILLLLPIFANAQSNIFIALEPNYMLGNRTWNKMGNDNYLNSVNVVGIGVRAGYEYDLQNNFFISSNLYFTNLNNGVKFDFTNSKLNQPGFEGDDTYMFSYYRALGITINGGYRIKISDRHSFDVSLGAHTEFAMSNGSNSILIADGLTPTMVYSDLSNQKTKFAWGFDGFFLWNFHIKNQRFFTGLHYSFSPSQTVNGSFESMTGFPTSNSGTYKLNVSYVGLNLGIRLGKK